MTPKQKKITGWVLSGLVTAFMGIASASGKFVEWEGKAEMFQHLGWSAELIQKIGVLEVLIALAILVPRVSFIGGLLVTAYLGGAVATHVRVGDPFWFPIVIGVIMWIGLGLRRPEIFSLAFGPEASPSDLPR